MRCRAVDPCGFASRSDPPRKVWRMAGRGALWPGTSRRLHVPPFLLCRLRCARASGLDAASSLSAPFQFSGRVRSTPLEDVVALCATQAS